MMLRDLGIFWVTAVLCGWSLTASAQPSTSSFGKLRTVRKIPSKSIPPRRLGRSLEVPRAPKGMATCADPVVLDAFRPRVGESLRYTVTVEGLSVGAVDFKTHQEGVYEGKNVTEYRSQFKITSLVSSFIPASGQAASYVERDEAFPVLAMNRYKTQKHQYEEKLRYGERRGEVHSARSKNGKTRKSIRRFHVPALDFVSAFYAARAQLPDSGCVLIYGNQKAYTFEITLEGPESVSTPVGMQPALRYRLRYGHERSRKPTVATLWIGTSPDRLPYRAIIEGKRRIDAKIQMFQPGRIASRD